MLTENQGDARHCQQIPIWSLRSSANTAHSSYSKPIPFLSLKQSLASEKDRMGRKGSG